jgi:hypothetical protein
MVPSDPPGGDRRRAGDAITYYVYANSHILLPDPGRGLGRRGERLVNFVWYRNYLVGGDLDDVLVGSDGVRRAIVAPVQPAPTRSTSCGPPRRTGCRR